jgi:hypothetical protein
LPEREFSEENQAVAIKRESQLLFRYSSFVSGFSMLFHDYRDSSVTAVTCGARQLGAALRFKPHHQITFAAKNLLNTNSRAVI